MPVYTSAKNRKGGIFVPAKRTGITIQYLFTKQTYTRHLFEPSEREIRGKTITQKKRVRGQMIFRYDRSLQQQVSRGEKKKWKKNPLG